MATNRPGTGLAEAAVPTTGSIGLQRNTHGLVDKLLIGDRQAELR